MRRQGEDVTFNTSESMYSLGLSNFEFRKCVCLCVCVYLGENIFTYVSLFPSIKKYVTISHAYKMYED